MESISRADAHTTLATLHESAEESALLLIGEHGSGKSHLLAAAHAMPTAPTVLVRVHPEEWRFPLSGFASLFAALRQDPSSEPHRYFALRSEDPDALFAAGYDLLSLIRGLDLPPTVALIDDLDRMDSASRAVLGTIASHLAGTSLWIVATATEFEPTEATPGFEPTQLLPFTADEIVEITMKDRDLDEPTVCILAKYAGGNPRVLEEQIARLQDDQLHGKASVLLPPRATRTIEEVTAKALGNVGPAGREILQLAALAPLCHTGALSQALPDAADDIEDLIDAGLLSRRGPYLTFTDQRLRSRFYWDQGSKARRQHHAALAEVCHLYDQHLATWHESSTARGPQSVDELLSAAISLVDEARIGAAVEFAERALNRAEHVESHAGLLIRLCNHLLRDGHLILADRYSARARAETTAPEQSMDILNIRLMARLFHKKHLVDDELSTLADLHAPANREGACSMICLGAAFRAERWETEEARRLVDHGLLLAEGVSEPTRLKLLAMRDIVDGMEGTAITEAPPTADLDDSLTADTDLLLLRARALTAREAYTDARQLLTVVHNRPASRNGLRHDLATYGTIHNEINATEYRLARAAIDTWQGRAPSLTRGTSAFAYAKAWYAYSLGQEEEADHLIDRCIELAALEASQALRARAMALRGTLRLLNGDAEAAVMELRQVSAASTKFRNPSLLRHWADYTEACVQTGRVQEAAATVTALERRLSSHRSRWGDLALLRCRGLVDTGQPSLALLDSAVKEFGRDELPYELGRTLRCLAIRQEELGMTVESRRTRMLAAAAFETAGADAWAVRTGQAPPAPATAATGTNGAPVLEQLSDDERDVAVRVVQGLRNREIAQELFVSVRTVELRLTHIYRSLGVHSRAQLVAVLTGANAPDAGAPPNAAPPPA
ncbi:LuxR family transcriptional regulator [Aeromicrobium ginsengisoli]|uniref:AAA family ATPase n=1 Tax=Aeromicrobium ginsengisoli TaxID=363867 RepID=A0A5M4FFU2_9ACTN|nr:LuxR family transcriptional regulator [Aeromicrobium ginsengisoli]KAA1397721.1 AAA family ATPase [Aeromicrobium ginsengisoli]